MVLVLMAFEALSRYSLRVRSSKTDGIAEEVVVVVVVAAPAPAPEVVEVAVVIVLLLFCVGAVEEEVAAVGLVVVLCAIIR